MHQLTVSLPNGKTAEFKSRVGYKWAVAALHPEGNCYWVSNHARRDLAEKAAKRFSNDPRNRFERWQGIVLPVHDNNA
jgi:hypothetical protein